MNIVITSHPIVNSYWVVPSRFRADEYPGSIQESEAREKIRWLLQQQIGFFLDLTGAGESGLKPYIHLLKEEAGQIQKVVIYKRIAIRDVSVSTEGEMVEILDTIDTALTEGHNIYLHCYAGKGRTGTVVGCYLVRHGTPGDEALEMIQNLRMSIMDDSGRSPETEGQRRMVLEWIKGL